MRNSVWTALMVLMLVLIGVLAAVVGVSRLPDHTDCLQAGYLAVEYIGFDGYCKTVGEDGLLRLVPVEQVRAE